MSATIRKDGTISFGNSTELLSIDQITREATKLFMESHARVQKISDDSLARDRVAELRKSCGAEPEYERMTIRVGIPGMTK